MTTATTTRPSPQAPWSPSHNLPIPSNTPAGYPGRTPGSAGQVTPGPSTSKLSSPAPRSVRTSSPNYFEYVANPGSNPPNSNAGIHAKKNWSPSLNNDRAGVVPSPQKYPLESQKRFENFRRQSESSNFKLGDGNLHQFSYDSGTAQSPTADDVQDQSERLDQRERKGGPLSQVSQQIPVEEAKPAVKRDGMSNEPPDDLREVPRQSLDSRMPTFFDDQARRDSPANDSNLDLSKMQRNQISQLDERHPRNSLPHNRVDQHPQQIQRAETLPDSLSTYGPTLISPQDVIDIVKSHVSEDLLLLDLRVIHQYSKSHISGALNLCIPTTLLKRSTYNTERLAKTFNNADEKAQFDRWHDAKIIVVYDAASTQLRDAISCVNTLKKFTNENWSGATFIIRGGFNSFAKKFPDQVDDRSASEINGSSATTLSIETSAGALVAGGCEMPTAQPAANPFFGTIRQNMDLIDGVGQLPVRLPSALQESATAELPAWLRQASDTRDKGKSVSERFLGIEMAEKKRMEKALSCNVSYGSPGIRSPNHVQIAGIEKGAKNRYKDILPYDHSRVRLQNESPGGCDYVNASHIQAEWSNRRYIASQAPVPATFQDFWRVAWEQDARVIVMLTAESEGGNRKCHPYWLPADYGPFKVKALSERKLSLEQSKEKPGRSFTTPIKLGTAEERPGMARRRSTNHGNTTASANAQPATPGDPDAPEVIVRKLTLSHANHPFEPLREITQLQYSSWPDFGTPAHPAHVLGLVEHCSSVVRGHESGRRKSAADDEPARDGERPIVVHCSAGCGRTGAFCTVDSVVDILKRQRRYRQEHMQAAEGVHDIMDVDLSARDAWLASDEEDLVAKTVSDFRLQRLSMVQTLRQFVLCYESVLEWVVGEMQQKNQNGKTS